MPTRSSRGGTLGSKRRPADQARTEILAAAERLFYRDGIAAVGVDAVAEAARVTKRTLYYHFASKDDLVATYLDLRDDATRCALDAVPTDRGAKPGDRVLAAFDFVERWAATPQYRGCPFNNAIAEQGASAKVTAIARRHKEAMRAWFAGKAAEGLGVDPESVGARLLVLLDGALTGAAVSGSPEPVAIARMMAEGVLDEAGVARTRRRR
jgi:AcrR family transcriptional regulator